jgi:hypothetical protein
MAPAKAEAKERHEVAEAKVVKQKQANRVRSEAVIRHLESVAEAHRKQKAGPSALDPTRACETPMQKTKGKQGKKKKTKVKRLLQLSAMAIMSHPFGAELASWTTGVAVDCGAEWSKEAIDVAIERGPHPTARAEDAMDLVHDDIKYQVEAGFTEVVYWDEIKENLPAHFKVSPVAVVPQTGRRGSPRFSGKSMSRLNAFVPYWDVCSMPPGSFRQPKACSRH